MRIFLIAYILHITYSLRITPNHVSTILSAPNVCSPPSLIDLTVITQELAARRKSDNFILNKITCRVNYLFKEDKILATASSFSILTRIKSAWSITEKLSLKGLYHVNNLRDIVGVRVIVDEGPLQCDKEVGYALCYRVLRCIASSPHVQEVTDLKDYIRAPKKNGYMSLHATIVPSVASLPRFEIQVRTKKMDDEASFGTAAHNAYKTMQNTYQYVNM